MVSSPQPSAGTNTYVEVVPLTLHIGAEIRGVDLSKPLPPEQLKEVRNAFLKWKVVFFRDQNLDADQQEAFVSLFGPPIESFTVGVTSSAMPSCRNTHCTWPPVILPPAGEA